MQCPGCYQENTEGSRFCNFCGVDMYAAGSGYEQQQHSQPAGYQGQQPQQQQQAGGGGENYSWDNFTKYLESQPAPKEKPQGGACSQCKGTGLEFYDNGQGYCPDCGRQFWWDKDKKPKEGSSQQVTQGGVVTQGGESYYGQEYEQEIMHKFMGENLPQDTDTALLEQMRRLGVLYREQRMSWAEFKEKLDELKEEFKA